VLIYDDWFSLGTGMVAILTYANRGIVYNCSFDSGFNSQPNKANANDTAIQLQNFADPTNSWSTNSMMGAKDTTGLNNFYIEDNYFANLYLHAMDYAAASRSVTRGNIFDNSALASHGADTGPVGVRYYEIYGNRFIFNEMGNNSLHQYDTYGMTWWFFDRGGTGVFFDNIIPLISSQAYPNKPSIDLTVMNLQRDAGPYPLWKTYPAPHEVGQGYENGSNITDPFYIWGNTGGGTANLIAITLVRISIRIQRISWSKVVIISSVALNPAIASHNTLILSAAQLVQSVLRMLRMLAVGLAALGPQALGPQLPRRRR
jgi:hypothetical protein